jgi:hypothetical protein
MLRQAQPFLGGVQLRPAKQADQHHYDTRRHHLKQAQDLQAKLSPSTSLR